ncbi:MAG: DUF1403 family protein [Methylocystis sp.]
MRFDPSDPFFPAPATAAPPSTRPRQRRSLEPEPHQSPLNHRPFPGWARVVLGTPAESPAAFFAAGASLALLDGVVRENPPCAGALRQRLALKAATASARLLRLREDEGALRDAEHLAASAEPGPAGRLHRLWRGLAGNDARLDAKRLGEALRMLDAPEPGDLSALFRSLQELAQGSGDPVTLAAQAAARAYHLCPAPEGEVFALWTADLLLALRLRWERPAPLLVTKILDPALRRGSAGARPRPGDLNWPEAVARAYALAVGDAHALASELSRRSEKLLAATPKLRAKRASRVVELLLTEDCVTSARAAKISGISDRAARRLFDRLLDLGAVRELSGRPSFRLYGL